MGDICTYCAGAMRVTVRADMLNAYAASTPERMVLVEAIEFKWNRYRPTLMVIVFCPVCKGGGDHNPVPEGLPVPAPADEDQEEVARSTDTFAVPDIDYKALLEE